MPMQCTEPLPSHRRFDPPPLLDKAGQQVARVPEQGLAFLGGGLERPLGIPSGAGVAWWRGAEGLARARGGYFKGRLCHGVGM